MNNEQREVLNALYEIEAERQQLNEYDGWTTVQDIVAQLDGTREELWVRNQLDSLWISRKILQIPIQNDSAFELNDIQLSGIDCHGDNETRIAVENDDVRGATGHQFEQVAIYDSKLGMHYRSRIAEIARLLHCNYQRFQMAPSTGLLRYERRPQRRPLYSEDLSQLIEQWCSNVRANQFCSNGVVGLDARYPIDRTVDTEHLATAIDAVLSALAQIFAQRGRGQNLARFQVESILRTLLGLYSSQYRNSFDAHVVTAGVGSGKSFAFQIGALIHVAYKALMGEKNIQVLLLYPRVVLAANQFQDLFELFDIVERSLNVGIRRPFLDAGGYLSEQMEVEEGESGRLFHSIRRAYQGEGQPSPFQVAISNLDTIANRIIHPECCAELTRDLDLVVFDEAHLLSGLYGAHTKMFLKRLELQRAMWRLRQQSPDAQFDELLGQHSSVRSAYFIAASATMAEPMRHVSRIIDRSESRVAAVEIESSETAEAGWNHHFFVRQRPETSSMSAVTNATSCLIHNRRDGLHREYYQLASVDGSRPPISLSDLQNPIQADPNIELRETRHIHKTVGFCDSLDGVGRWADLVADNEQTKTESMKKAPNPGRGNMPYFVRFQEPLWRVVHHLSFAASNPAWSRALTDNYGDLCRKCKMGVRACTQRMPDGLTNAQQNKVNELWQINPDPQYKKSYLDKMGVGKEQQTSDQFAPVVNAIKNEQIENLDRCPFFQTRLCWWWSMDHVGNNKPRPVSAQNPMAGFKQPHTNSRETFYHTVNSISVLATESIDDLYRLPSNYLLRSVGFERNAIDNCNFVIGSPRLEVGIDLSRACDGITYRAMRDPSSLQQKTGRVGRELNADSLLIHVVTENARDHYYFRNPRIALDPEYLQPVRLHENNQIIAKNHYFMAIVDFICQQGVGPTNGQMAEGGHRVNLVNDHEEAQTFRGSWERKVDAIWQFFSGSHARQSQNLNNLTRYLELLGATPAEITNPALAQSLLPRDSPSDPALGAIDVFLHDFGPNLLLTELGAYNGATNLAQLCSYPHAPTNIFADDLPRHLEAIRWLNTIQKPYRDRSYLWNLLTMPLFLRGLPEENMPSNQPYLWTSNFFEPVGNQYVSVFEQRGDRAHELGAEPLSMALALLSPGTFTYRYTSSVRKVPVDSFGGTGLQPQTPGREERVWLDVDDSEFFEPVACDPLGQNEVPNEFSWMGSPVPVFAPRRIGLARANSQPRPTIDGLIADDDERPRNSNPQLPGLATPPRCYALKWYRLNENEPAEIECRFASRFHGPGGRTLEPLPLPEVTRLFSSINVESRLDVTEFIWGLDRQFMTRQVDAARLLYWQNGSGQPAVLGENYETPALRFELNLGNESAISQAIEEIWNQPESGVNQSLLIQSLTSFLNRFAGIRDPNAPPFVPPQPPSIFTVRNIRTILLFHLLDLWHPDSSDSLTPETPFWLTVDAITGCFQQGQTTFINEQRYRSLCHTIANLQNPASAATRQETLEGAYPNFASACASSDQFNATFLTEQAQDLLLNTLGITLHSAALRQTGAESSDIAYFYRRLENGRAAVYLFDTDAYGNGTVDMIQRNFFVSSVERTLNTRQRAMGIQVDALPSTDFVHCFEEALQECSSSHAFQLAFQDVNPANGPLSPLTNMTSGERQIGGTLYDFLRQSIGAHFDNCAAFQACPEFLANLGTYDVYSASWQIPSPQYPSFQALESSVGFCHHGCVQCVLAPEQNLHGTLTARDTVNKLLLDVVYRDVVCMSETAASTYPATGTGRTCSFEEVALVVSSAVGVSVAGITQTVELQLGETISEVVVSPQYALGSEPWFTVFRSDWTQSGEFEFRCRPHMEF